MALYLRNSNMIKLWLKWLNRKNFSPVLTSLTDKCLFSFSSELHVKHNPHILSKVTCIAFYQFLVSLGIEPVTFALLVPWSTVWRDIKGTVHHSLAPKLRVSRPSVEHEKNKVFWRTPMGSSVVWFPTFLKISPFVFFRRKSVTETWNDASKWRPLKG